MIPVVALGLLAPSGARAGFDAEGWVVDWLLYGPLAQSHGATPGIPEIRADYIADGLDVHESTMLPEQDAVVSPDFFGASAADDFHLVVAEVPARWQAVSAVEAGDTTPDTMDLIQLYDPVGALVDFAVVYGCVYLSNPGADPLTVRMQFACDDSAQVKLDDCEVIAHSGSQAYGAAGTWQHEADLEIAPGAHRLLVKVFNGGGDYGFRLRFVDPTTGAPITDSTSPALEVALDAEGAELDAIRPSGIGVTRTMEPDTLIGLDQNVTVTLEVTQTYAELDGETPVVIRETLPPGIRLATGTDVPTATSVTDGVVEWRLPAEDAVAGVRYELELDEPGLVCVGGEIAVGDPVACSMDIPGASCALAVAANALYLGDIVGGGDGYGTKDPSVGGIDIDTGLLISYDQVAGMNGNTEDFDLINPAPVEESEWVDSVFFMNTATMPINTEGVEFTFDANDVHTGSWNGILSNVTHDIDKGPGNMRVGGQEPFATGVGVHASAGVTFDLRALREEFGADKVVQLVMLTGTDGCGAGDTANNNITLYVIYSTEEEILAEHTWKQPFAGADLSEPYEAPIPEDAVFLTLATGRGTNGGIGCDHGVFAEARIFPELPRAVATADPPGGGTPLTVTFDGGDSSAPAGRTVETYRWDFGDGATGTGETVEHTYTVRGRYVATLTVLDSEGYAGSTRIPIQTLFQPGDVSPWTSTDVGAPTTPGGARLEDECLVVFGGGVDISRRADEFHFVHQPVRGDVTLTCQVRGALWEPTPQGRAGLMLRAGTDVDSPFAFVQALPVSTGIRPSFAYRTAAGGTVRSRSAAIDITPPDSWLRLRRTGDEFVGQASTDGVEWTEVYRAELEEAPSEMLGGLAVTARDMDGSDRTATVTFCDVEIDSDPGGAEIFHRGDADGSGVVNITDGIFVLNFLFLGGPTPACREAANADDSEAINITDGIYILNYLFLGGPTPAPPGGTDAPCGPDPAGSPSDLGCESYDGC